MERRHFLQASLLAPLFGCGAGVGVGARAQEAAGSVSPEPGRAADGPGSSGGDPARGGKDAKLRIVCICAHPDDAESGCGGTLARYIEAGHAVTIVYLTRGELGVEGETPDSAARIRTREAEEACKILGAKPVFLTQKNGQTEASPARADELKKALEIERPDVFFAHWPMDTDIDHQIASILAIRVYLAAPRPYPLYFFEVDTGVQSLGFRPTAFVDISKTREKKILALKAHKSQSFERTYEKNHEKIEAFRGRELGVFAAEAFAVLGPDAKTGLLPGL